MNRSWKEVLQPNPYVFGAFFILFLAFCLNGIANNDIWWHLALGEWVVQNGQQMYSDQFSFTIEDKRVQNVYWLFQVFAYLLHQIGGWFILVVFKVIIIFIPFALFYKRYGQEHGSWMFYLFMLGFIFLAQDRWVLRPEIATYFFIACFIIICTDLRKNPKMGYLLILFQVLWSNMHLMSLLGICLVGAFFVAELLMLIPFLQKFGYDERPTLAHLIHHFKILCGVILASLVNTHPMENIDKALGLFRFISTVSTSGRGTSHIVELASIRGLGNQIEAAGGVGFFNVPMFFYAIVGFTFFTFLINFRRTHYAYLIICVAFTYLGWATVRNVYLLGLVGVLAVTYNWDQFVRTYSPQRLFSEKALQRLQQGLTIIFVSICLYWSYTIVTNKFYLKLNISERFAFTEVNPLRYPTAMAEFMKEKELEGRIMNEFNLGGFFMYHLAPKVQVFIDPRGWHAPGFQRKWFASISSFKSLQRITKQHEISLLHLDTKKQKGKTVLKELYDSEEWKLIYFDYSGSLWQRVTEENKEKLTRWEKKAFKRAQKQRHRKSSWQDEWPYVYYGTGRFYFLLGKLEEAAEFYEKTLKIYAYASAPYFQLAAVYSDLKQFEKAEGILYTAIEKCPEDRIKAYNILVRVQDALGKHDLSWETALLALRGGTRDQSLLINLFKAAKRNRNLQVCEEALLQYARVNKGDYSTFLMLHKLYTAKKQPQQARRYYQKYVTTKYRYDLLKEREDRILRKRTVTARRTPKVAFPELEDNSQQNPKDTTKSSAPQTPKVAPEKAPQNPKPETSEESRTSNNSPTAESSKE